MARTENPGGFTDDDMEEFGDRATWMLTFVGSLDPTWQKKIEACHAEKGLSPLQMVTAWIAAALENDRHMSAPPHPFFQPGFQPSTGKCLGCGKKFKPEFAGQGCCNDSCYREYSNRQNPLPAEVF